MRTLTGLALSLILALLGAALWVGASRLLDIRLFVLLACVVGGLAGYGMALGSKAKGGLPHALLAALVCLTACLAAKGTIAWFRANQNIHEELVVSEEDAYDLLVEQHYAAITGGDDSYEDEHAYESAVMAASDQWRSMSRRERTAHVAAVQAEWDAGKSLFGSASLTREFLLSWRIIDIICVCSALGTAFKIGSHRVITDDEVPAWAQGPGKALNTPQSAAMAANMEAAARANAAPGPAFVPQTQASTAGLVGANNLRAVPPTQPGSAGVVGAIGPRNGAPTTDSAPPADSFWTRLGSEPTRETPSLRRTPKPNTPPQADAA